jgi:hypothetical protein
VFNTGVTGQPIDENTNHEWEVFADFGKGLIPLPSVVRARFVNRKRDMAFNLAKSPDGNFSTVTRVGGGGAVSLLYTVDEAGQLWIGGVMQMRRNIDADKPVFNAMRGYNRPGEGNLSAALREALEESGRDDLMMPIQLKGETLNADSAMNDSLHGGGVDFFRVEVPFEALIRNEDGTFSFNTTDLTDEQRAEGIYKVLFVRGDLKTIARLADSFTVVGFTRLIADLAEEADTIDYWSDPIRPPYSVD